MSYESLSATPKTAQVSLAQTASKTIHHLEKENEGLFSMLLEEFADIPTENRGDGSDEIGDKKGENFVKIAQFFNDSDSPFTKMLSLIQKDEKRYGPSWNIEQLSTIHTLISKDKKNLESSLDTKQFPELAKLLAQIVDDAEKPLSETLQPEQLLKAFALRAAIAGRSRNATLQKSASWLHEVSKSEKTNLSELLDKAKSLGLEIRSAEIETVPNTSASRLSNAAAEMLQRGNTKSTNQKSALFTSVLLARDKKEPKVPAKLSASEISLGHLLEKEEKSVKPASIPQHVRTMPGETNLESLLESLNHSESRKKSHHTTDKRGKGFRLNESPTKTSIETSMAEKNVEEAIKKPLAKSPSVQSGPKGLDVSIAAQTVRNHRHHHDPTPKQVSDSSIDIAESPHIDPSTSPTKEGGLSPSVSISKSHANEMLTQKIVDARATLHHFTRQLNEEIENYKPPFTRLKMQMDPKDLGSVEVTMITRGSQLHIQVHSNPTAIGLMATQGNELKNQLVSMGFTDVQMQFNMNQHQQQERRRQASQNGGYVAVEEIPDFYESLDLIIPQYV